MARIRVVKRVHALRLAVLAFVFGWVAGLLLPRCLPGGTPLPRGRGALTVPTGWAWLCPLAAAPAGCTLPFFDQRFRRQLAYMACAAAGATVGLTSSTGFSAGELLARGSACLVALWLVGLAAAGLGLLISRACFRLVVQDGTRCPGCGYCLIGLSRRVCPECGRPFSYAELGTTPQRLAGAAEASARKPGTD